LSHVSIPGKNDIKETAIAAPNERAVEARRGEDEIGFGRAAKVAGRVLLIRDSIFEIQSRTRNFHFPYVTCHFSFVIARTLRRHNNK
jgi:hypothetical protein